MTFLYILVWFNLIFPFGAGLSDPYVTLKLHDGATTFSKKTKVIPKTVNPVWNETFEL